MALVKVSDKRKLTALLAIGHKPRCAREQPGHPGYVDVFFPARLVEESGATRMARHDLDLLGTDQLLVEANAMFAAIIHANEICYDRKSVHFLKPGEQPGDFDWPSEYDDDAQGVEKREEISKDE